MQRGRPRRGGPAARAHRRARPVGEGRRRSRHRSPRPRPCTTTRSRRPNRIRALYADSAATRAQLDAAETGLARAEAGVRGRTGRGVRARRGQLVLGRSRSVRRHRHEALRRSRRVRRARRAARDHAGRVDAPDQRECDTGHRARSSPRADASTATGRRHAGARHVEGVVPGDGRQSLHDQRARRRIPTRRSSPAAAATLARADGAAARRSSCRPSRSCARAISPA